MESVWENADYIVEGEYSTGAQEQLYIETNGMIAAFDADRGVTVWGSLQCPYYVHKALMALFDLPENKVRVVQTETGGAFGGKEEYPSMIAGHAALLAMKSGRPVKIIYDRAEDMVATTKRHPSRTRHRTAVRKDGKILGGEIDFVIDGGAYLTLVAGGVLARRRFMRAGPTIGQRCAFVRRPWPRTRRRTARFAGSARRRVCSRWSGTWIASRKLVGLSPVEIRRVNFLKPGRTTITEQTIQRADSIWGKCSTARSNLPITIAQKETLRAGKQSAARSRRGIGIAAFLHGAGFTGSGERYLDSVVGVEGTRKDGVRVLVSSTEFGQGTNTVLCQIAAETLGLPYEDVEVAQPDTMDVPNSGPTVASRTAMVVGKLVESAARGIEQTLIGAGHARRRSTQPEEFRAACRTYVVRARRNFGRSRDTSRRRTFSGMIRIIAARRMRLSAWAIYVARGDG